MDKRSSLIFNGASDEDNKVDEVDTRMISLINLVGDLSNTET